MYRGRGDARRSSPHGPRGFRGQVADPDAVQEHGAQVAFRPTGLETRMTYRMLYPWNWKRRARGVLLAAVMTAVTIQGRADPFGLAGMFAHKREAISDAIRIGQWESYASGYAWHLPYQYQGETRARLNETTWGGGVGRTILDGDGDRHSVCLLVFSDSHRTPQWNLGYGWQRYWSPTPDFGLGGGYLAFLFSRRDVANNLPIPALLPCASIRYRGIELIGMFIPRISRDITGDVLYFCLRMPFGRTRVRE